MTGLDPQPLAVRGGHLVQDLGPGEPPSKDPPGAGVGRAVGRLADVEVLGAQHDEPATARSPGTGRIEPRPARTACGATPAR